MEFKDAISLREILSRAEIEMCEQIAKKNPASLKERKPIVINTFSDIYDAVQDERKVNIGDEVIIEGKTGKVTDIRYGTPGRYNLGRVQVSIGKNKQDYYVSDRRTSQDWTKAIEEELIK